MVIPRNHLNIDDYPSKIRAGFSIQTEDCIVIGNGPSAERHCLEDKIANSIIFRCNWFFLEEKPRFGRRVDCYFWSVYNKELFKRLTSPDVRSKYDIGRFFMPFNINHDKHNERVEACVPLTPTADHWSILAQNSTVARFMMGRPLPTQGIQMIAVAAILGFKRIYVAGVDMYNSDKVRYGYKLPVDVVKALQDKDIRPGYEDHHSLDNDLKYLDAIRSQYDFELCGSESMTVMSSYFDKSLSYSSAEINDNSETQSLGLEDTAYVTLADGMHAFGAIALARSIEKHTDKKLIILYTTPSTKFLCSGLSNVILRPVQAIENPHNPKQERFRHTFTKLRIFELLEYKRLIYIDADCLMLSSIEDLFDRPEQILAAPDWGSNMNSSDFNSGLIAFSPSESLRNQVFSNIYSFDSNDGGDQGYLNEVLKGKTTFLHPSYNTLKRLLVHHSAYISFDDVKVLHFVGHKPWDSKPNAKDYAELDRLWIKSLALADLELLIYYQRYPSRFAELNNLKSPAPEIVPANVREFSDIKVSFERLKANIYDYPSRLAICKYLYARGDRDSWLPSLKGHLRFIFENSSDSSVITSANIIQKSL